MKKTLPMLLGLLAMASFAGCAMFNKATTTVNHNRTITTGKELVDLMEARDSGAISEEEYAKLKKTIMVGAPCQAGIEVKVQD